MNIAAVENRQRITVIFAEPFLDFRCVDIKRQRRCHVDPCGLGAGTAKLQRRQRGDEYEGCQKQCLTTQDKPPMLEEWPLKIGAGRIGGASRASANRANEL